MPKWTPGPWHTGRSISDEVYVQRGGSGGFLIMDYENPDRAMADAKLIAKAPEMVELLKDTVRWLSDTAPIGFSEPLTAAKALLKEIDDDPG